MNSKLNQLLNRQVANYAVLFVKLHNYHWYVKGKDFYQLHAKFEEFYDGVNEAYDLVAERLLMIGGQPAATMKEYLEIASLKEGAYNLSAEEMLSSILADFEQLNKETKEVVDIASEAGDDVTVDIFTDISSKLQKDIWMLKATLS